MKKMHIIISIIIALCMTCLTVICRNNKKEQPIITDMLLYEHDNSNFYIDVNFTDISFDMIAIKIIDSQTFSVNDEPEPIHSSTIRKLEIEYSVLPLSEVIEKCTVIYDAPTSSIPWDIDGRKHDLYIIDQKYMLYQYIDVNYYNHPQRGSMWWQPLYEADKETQAKILEYADYDNRKDGYKFGPLYHATAEGQIQCIYKYGNKVYYRQIN